MASKDDELSKVQAALAQREAACLRLEGENFLLKAQVNQIQSQSGSEEIVKEVRATQSYVARAQQVLDCIMQSRMSLRTDAEQVRAILSAARRSVRKVLQFHEGSQNGRGTQRSGPVESKMVSTTRLAAKPAPASQRAARGSPTLLGRERSCQGEGKMAPKPSKTSPGGAGNASPTNGSSQKAGGAAAESLTQLAELNTKFVQQRELLVVAVRRGAQAEANVLDLKDDLTRKDIIIHNLKRDVSILKGNAVQYDQELQKQSSLHDSQLRLLQQQHHAQQLQQAQQYRTLEEMLQRQMEQQTQPAQESTSSTWDDASSVSERPARRVEPPVDLEMLSLLMQQAQEAEAGKCKYPPGLSFPA